MSGFEYCLLSSFSYFVYVINLLKFLTRRMFVFFIDVLEWVDFIFVLLQIETKLSWLDEI